MSNWPNTNTRLLNVTRALYGIQRFTVSLHCITLHVLHCVPSFRVLSVPWTASRVAGGVPLHSTPTASTAVSTLHPRSCVSVHAVSLHALEPHTLSLGGALASLGAPSISFRALARGFVFAPLHCAAHSHHTSSVGHRFAPLRYMGALPPMPPNQIQKLSDYTQKK